MSMIASPSEEHKPRTEWPAHALKPETRQRIGVAALAKTTPITALADDHEVSRKFVYQQRDRAEAALDRAFCPPLTRPEVLFYIPVTKAWLSQVVLVLLLCCHSSYRGVQEFFRCLFDRNISLGKIHNIVSETVPKARAINDAEMPLFEDILDIAVDEIFQQNRPVLAGIDLFSSYCFMLEDVCHRDAPTWEKALKTCRDGGLSPEQAITDAGKGLCAALPAVWPDILHGDDHFHRFWDFGKLVHRLEETAFKALAKLEKVEKKVLRASWKREGQRYSKRLAVARKEARETQDLSEDMAILYGWLRCDILARNGPSSIEREEMLDFVVEEMRAREGQHGSIKTLRTTLENQKNALLMFARRKDMKLYEAAQRFGVSVEEARVFFELMKRPESDRLTLLIEVRLRQILGDGKFEEARAEMEEIERRCVRASSLVENLNSRLRNYFFLRKRAGKEFCELLRFYLNHSRFTRSRRSERKGKSPAEVLSGEEQRHWLEQLGYTLFKPSP